MKTIRIISLSIVVVGIVAFWLMPGINKAGNETYTRVYEDTERAPVLEADPNLPDTTKPGALDKKIEVKYYKSESIEPETKLSDIKASMFSRAIQFEKEEELLVVEELQDDSLRQHMQASIDSLNEILMAKKINVRHFQPRTFDPVPSLSLKIKADTTAH
jgi:hypothetical protein